MTFNQIIANSLEDKEKIKVAEEIRENLKNKNLETNQEIGRQFESWKSSERT